MDRRDALLIALTGAVKQLVRFVSWFKDRPPDNKRYVSVADLWGPGALQLSRQIEVGFVDAYDRCYQTIRTYPISLVEVRDKNLADVCKIFRRINSVALQIRFYGSDAVASFEPAELLKRFGLLQ